MTARYRRILVIDLLGGLGDLLLVLPAIRALAHRHRSAMLHVLTHAPGASLLISDPDVTGVTAVEPAHEPVAVAETLDHWRPDLVVSTTRYGGIPDIIAARDVRAVTDLWRSPPVQDRIDERYLRILRDEGLVDSRVATPGGDTRDVHRTGIHLTADELDQGERTAAAALTGRSGAPVVLLTTAGMAVKEWPTGHWDALAGQLTHERIPVLVCAEHRVRLPPGATLIPPTGLRGLAAIFRAIGRRGGVAVGADTGPLRLAVAAGVRAVGLFGPTVRDRYGLPPGLGVNLQGLPGCPHRRPLAITEQSCWWTADCPLSPEGPACMADIPVPAVRAAVVDLLATS